MDPVDVTRKWESTASNTFRLTQTPPLFVRGQGCFLYTSEGTAFLDLVCGSAASLLGHGHPAHKAAISEVVDSGILHTGTRLPSLYRAGLYEALGAILPPHLDRIHLANSGAEAIETALKAAIHHTGRRHVIAFEGGYHGRTLGALAVTHAPPLRDPFEPWSAPWVTFVPYVSSDTDNAIYVALSRLETALKATPVAAVIVEAVQGVSGVLGPVPRFLEGVQRLANAHGALLIADEIWSGFGRAGRWFSFQHANLEPDLVACGKGLSASLPLSAVAGRGSVLSGWKPGSHTSTFQGNPVAAAAATATLHVLADEGLVDRADKELAPAMMTALQRLDARVVGAQAAIDLGSRAAAERLQRRALEANILVYGGGTEGQCVVLLPPLNIDIEVLVEAIKTLRGLM